MFVIWRGWGILAPVIPILVWALIPLTLKPLMAEATYQQYFGQMTAISGLMGAVALWYIGRWFNSGEKTLVDPETGEEVMFKPSHSLFFIKMEYWAIPFVLFSLFLLSASLA